MSDHRLRRRQANATCPLVAARRAVMASAHRLAARDLPGADRLVRLAERHLKVAVQLADLDDKTRRRAAASAFNAAVAALAPSTATPPPAPTAQRAANSDWSIRDPRMQRLVGRLAAKTAAE
ncbi:MAG: hypothetical protein JNM59_08805 [Hyphomonadaceae bacterium]|nr:hypothetical protein [Hyphomonadaceae bacterium]